MTDPVERCLGLDVGEKRIGLALSDPLGWTASPLPTLSRESWRKDVARIREAVERWEIRRVVVGLPIRMDGTSGEAAESILRFVERLRSVVRVAVETWDERLSTREAERMLVGADVRRNKRRQVIDGIAASLILQGYLDYRNSGGKPR
jgi:putative holliday junction resolvase